MPATKDPSITKGRNKGGISLFIKQSLKNLITILQVTNDWIYLQIKKSSITFNTNLNVLLPYISHSTYTEIWPKFESLIQNAMQPPIPLLIIGDFNTRVAKTDLNLSFCNTNPYLANNRQSKDSTQDRKGNKLSTLLKQSKLSILNGRSAGDPLGSFTSYSYSGASIIDLAILSNHAAHLFHNFKILPSIISDHMPLQVSLLSTMHPKSHEASWFPTTQKMFWDPLKTTAFQILLENRLSNNYSPSPQNSYDHITSTILQAATELNMLKTISSASTKKKKAPWYNHQCHLAKQVTYQALINLNNNHNMTNRIKYIKEKKNLAILYSKEKKQYLAEWSQKLTMAKTSQAFWRLIGKLSTSPATNSSIITPETWYSYFNKLYKTTKLNRTNRAFMQYIEKLTSKYHTTTPQQNFSTKQMDVTTQETLQAFKSLKSGKAPGKDLLLPECFKHPSP